MSKHTPGPWKIKFVVQDGCSIQNWFMLCNLQTAKEFVAEAEPNRKLIEAAPDLLEACKRILGALNEFGFSELEIMILEKAIAKAEGK